MQKSNLARMLRAKAAEEGLRHHPDRDLAEKRYDEILETAEKTLKKSRAKKLGNKKKLSAEEIAKQLQEIEESYDIGFTDVPKMFEHFRITLTVCPPTARRMDPPNLYPTFKAMVDGLTDASWWVDDQFSNLLEVSFRYGGVSGEKDIYKLIFDIEEIPEDEVSQYVLEAKYVDKD